MMIYLPRSLANEIVARARASAPDECWGMLAGTGARVTEVFHLENGAGPDDRPFRYETEFRSQAAAERELMTRDLDMLGIYHSHTHTQPYPSPTDIEHANPLYGDIVYLIVSLRQAGQPFVFRGMSEEERQRAREYAATRPARPELRGWHIRDGRALPADLRIARG